jgi:hypothetical protein
VNASSIVGHLVRTKNPASFARNQAILDLAGFAGGFGVGIPFTVICLKACLSLLVFFKKPVLLKMD